MSNIMYRYVLTSLHSCPPTSCSFLLGSNLKVGDALIAINNVSVKDMTFAEIMQRMKFSLREAPYMVLRFRTMEERYRLLRMKVRWGRSWVVPP